MDFGVACINPASKTSAHFIHFSRFVAIFHQPNRRNKKDSRFSQSLKFSATKLFAQTISYREQSPTRF